MLTIRLLHKDRPARIEDAGNIPIQAVTSYRAIGEPFSCAALWCCDRYRSPDLPSLHVLRMRPLPTGYKNKNKNTPEGRSSERYGVEVSVFAEGINAFP